MPVLVVVLHPRVFYGTVNRILARLNKTPLERTLSFKRLLGLLGWSLLGLAWQGLSIWVSSTTCSTCRWPSGGW